MYTEVVVPRKDQPVMKLLRTVLMVLTAVCLGMGMFFLPMILAAALLFGGYWLVSQKVNIEYQYYHLDDDFELDKVIGNNRRKHIASVSMSQVQMVAPVDSDQAGDYDGWKTLDVSAGDPERKPWVMACVIDGTKTRVLLQMNEKLLKAFRRQLGAAKVPVSEL